MFGWGIHVAGDRLHLIVTDPISWLALLVAALPTLAPLLYKLTTKPISSKSTVFFGILTVTVYAFVLDGAELALNRTTGTATMRRFVMYHWTSKTFPLTSLDHAYLDTGATTSRIVLLFTDGQTRSLSGNNQIGGKPEAVFAINNFLRGTEADRYGGLGSSGIVVVQHRAAWLTAGSAAAN